MKILASLVACYALLITAASADATPRVVVEPNILVTRDIDAPHTETSLAADPGNAKHLLGAVTTFARMGDGLYDKPQASIDGGYTWFDSTPADAPFGSGDPQTAYGLTGTAYFLTLN